MHTFRFSSIPVLSLLFLGVGLVLVQPCAGASGVFEKTGSLATPRTSHTATLLPNGKVLVAGGNDNNNNNNNYLASAELYDPVSGGWTATGSLATARAGHTATLLPNGKVLVAGGYNNSNSLASAELYDPASGSWAATGSLATARAGHTATLLPNGKVLVAGGLNSSGPSAELYDPANGSWTATGSLGGGVLRYSHTATLLPNGKVLVAGGSYGTGYFASAELYDPASGSWTATGSLATARRNHTATLLPNGKVLVAGGFNCPPCVFGRSPIIGMPVSTIGDMPSEFSLASTELYDPVSGSWTATGGLATARYSHTATLLPNGQVLVAGGFGTGSSDALASAELFDFVSGSWTATGSLATARCDHTATLLANGKVLVAGGFGPSGALASVELYDAASGSWTTTSNLVVAERYGHTATLLPNGKVLVAGGSHPDALASAELYDPANGSWTPTGNLIAGRLNHTATLLANGKVLVAGGVRTSPSTNGPDRSAELYDPASGNWTATGNLVIARSNPTATLLPNGKVLVIGGSGDTSAELYDPASSNWTATGNLVIARSNPTATLLPNGKVLVAGGSGDTSAELYDPASGMWTATGNLGTTRVNHTATLLPNGKVLVAGGVDGGTYLASAELYDPASGTWTATGSLATPRQYHTATELPNGKVLVAGGNYGVIRPYLTSAELYDPATGGWTATGSLGLGRYSHRATLLLNGEALVTGGVGVGYVPRGELYDVGLGFNSAWQPQIATTSSILQSGNRLMLTGSLFQGISQASGGNTQDSSSNYPIVQLRSLDSSQVVFLSVDPTAGWSNTAFTSVPVSGFPFGPASVTVFTNGIPSAAKYLVVAPATILANISSRLRVETGDNALFGGFIVTGTQPKKIILRVIGPSLPFADKLADPILELHDSFGTLLETNDNWMDSPNKQAIIDSTIPPPNPLESAIVRTVPPAAYTAIVRGVNNGTGIGVIELYDLDTTANSKFANISTRGLVQTGDDVLIAGTIMIGQASQKVIIRAVGPSLSVPGKMADPTLELHDGNGALLEANDNWVDSPNKQAIIDSTIPPPNNLESAIVRTLTPANYTAIVRGVGGSTGIAVVEVYALN
jgi:uncharacterized delta-60 repeat protein